MTKKINNLIGLGFVTMLLIAVFFNKMIHFITDYQWFNELGYRDIFLKKIITQLQIGIPIFLVGSIGYYFYLITLKRSYYKTTKVYHMGLSEKRVNQILALPALVLGFMTSTLVAGKLWLGILRYFNAELFHETDPIFQKDIGFYIFHLPILGEILNTLILLLMTLIPVTIMFYIIMFFVRRPTLYEAREELNWHNTFFTNLVRLGLKQLVVVGALFFIILAAKYYLGAYDLLYSTRGVVFGASYTDIYVTRWIYGIQVAVSLLGAIFLIGGYLKGKPKVALFGPIAIIAVSFLGNLGATVVQSLIVAPNEIAKERPFIEHNIAYTRKAYNIENIQEYEFQVINNINLEDIENNQDTIRNIRINDYRPAIEIYNQLQTFRLYYRFVDVDIDRYHINGSYKQVFLAPREMDQERLGENAKTWINQHLKYTHGYGVALSPVNSVTRDGQPELLIRNIPVVSTVDIEVNRPEIYFGELTNNYIILNTKEREFHYPLGNNNAETIYEGQAGISLKGINRLLYAIRQGSLKMLLSSAITQESKIVLHRNILDRVDKIAPFIYYDEDPYIVIYEGRILWIIDGYTISNNYPYAEPFMRDNQNYIRNAVKVVVDAYHGKVDYYICDEKDPIILTYKNIFPGFFKDIKDMPQGLKEHIRYPQVLFDIQSQVYATYHMTNPTVFFGQEDLWNIAREKYGDRQQRVESQYMIMKLPGQSREEFILSVPYTPNEKDNMTSLLVARNDGEHYGELILYRFPKGENIYGPEQIESRIDQDSNISQNLTLWGQGGSSVIRGNLLVVPIENALLYVEPLYIRASGTNSLPEVKKVIVAYGDRIVMEDTLDLALGNLFGYTHENPILKEVGDPQERLPMGEQNEIRALIQRASQAFDNAKNASQRGHWAEYGRALEELEKVLKQLDSQKDSL